MSKPNQERIMRIKDRIKLDDLRFLRDEYGPERIRMKSLYMAVVEYMLEDLLKQYGYNISRCARGLGISTKTIYRKLKKKKSGNSPKE